MSPAEAIVAGARAEAALEVIEPVLITLRARMLEALIATSDPDKVRQLHAGCQMFDAIRQEIIETISNGQIARATED